mgnify:CR=1 FL=1
MTTTLARTRTRFAPSPTGTLHIGGARTALSLATDPGKFLSTVQIGKKAISNDFDGDGKPVGGAKVLTAREQRHAVCIWAEVDPTRDSELRHFRVYGTGHRMPDEPGTYVGTAMPFGGAEVYHVYEEPRS